MSNDDHVPFLDGLNLDEPIKTKKELQREAKQQEKEEQKAHKKQLQAELKHTTKVLIENNPRRQVLLTILTNHDNDEKLKPFLKQMGFDLSSKSIQERTDEELEELLANICMACNSHGTTGFWKDMLFTAAQMGETIAVRSRLNQTVKLAGFTDRLKASESFDFRLRCMILQNPGWFSVSPSVHFSGEILKSAVAAHTQNVYGGMVEKLIELKRRRDETNSSAIVSEDPLAPPKLVRQDGCTDLLQSSLFPKNEDGKAPILEEEQMSDSSDEVGPMQIAPESVINQPDPANPALPLN